MILPNIRMSFGREESAWLVRLLSGDDPGNSSRWESVLAERGIDPLLDEPGTVEVLLNLPGVSLVPAPLAIYVFVRHALLQSGIESRMLADYVAALVLEFGYGDRSFRISPGDDREYRYLVDILQDLEAADGRRAFLLRVHLGNFSLWLSGLFPDFITARVHTKGGPGLDYYEEMGRAGFEMAAGDPHARREHLQELYEDAAHTFGGVRRALNRFSDRLLFPHASSPVDRLLRQVQNDFLEA